jgi:hypothetical protein
MPKSLSVVIPTFRREAGLHLAMQSVTTQILPKMAGLDGLELSLIVCDNSPEASAKAQVEAFAAEAAFPVTFVHEPQTGVANARNAAVAATSAEFIAFLDDDEEAPPYWLARLIETQERFAADVVFGPVKARLQDLEASYPVYFESFFSRTGPKISQRLNGYYGCGNSLIRRSVLPEGRVPFCTDRNEMGGEDDQLFHDLQTDGAIIAWAADALVYEDVPASRSTLGYTLKRAFAFGQGPSHSAAISHRPLAVAYWMAQGVVQGILFSIIGGALYMIGSRQSAPRLDKAMRGFGKLIWFPPFKIGFYGAALLQAQPPGR